MVIPRERTELRVPMYWGGLTKVPDLGTWKFFSNYTDVGTLSSTYIGMFTERVVLWIPKSVNLLRNPDRVH